MRVWLILKMSDPFAYPPRLKIPKGMATHEVGDFVRNHRLKRLQARKLWSLSSTKEQHDDLAKWYALGRNS